MRQEIYRFLCWRGGKNGAHKHLCGSVGGYGINPPPKGGCICIAWKKGSSHRFCWKPRESSTLIARREKPFHQPYQFQIIFPIKTTFFFFTPAPFPSCLHLTFERRPPHDSSTYQPPASHSQWRGWYRPFIIWTGGIEEGTGSLLSCLALAWGLIQQMEKPMADWQHPLTRWPARLSLPPLPLSLT